VNLRTLSIGVSKKDFLIEIAVNPLTGSQFSEELIEIAII